MNEQAADKLGAALVACTAIAVVGWLVVKRGNPPDVNEAAQLIGEGARTILDTFGSTS